MKNFKRIIDNTKENTLVTKLRRRRFNLFLSIIKDIPKPVKILDVGGIQIFWEMMNFVEKSKCEITILNIDEIETSFQNFRSVIGDAGNMDMFKDEEFDIVFSNSMIEHVGTLEGQKKVAKEISRVGKRYFVQTPNYYFPIEPHFMFPFFQFYPMSLKIFIAQTFSFGWIKKCKTKKETDHLINSICLLKERDFRMLFPSAKIYKEKFLFLTKSFIAIKF